MKLRIRESSNSLHEQDIEIEVKNKGILEVPEDKNVDELPMSHFEKLVKKHGLSKITKALNNLQVWNRNDDKELSKWTGNMIDELTKKYGKNESLKESSMYDYYDVPDGAFDMYNDMPTEEDEMWSELSTKQREIINALEELGYSGSLTRFFNKIIGSWTKVYDTDKSTSSGVEITVDLDGEVIVQEFAYSIDEEDLTDLSPVKIVKSSADVKKLDSWAKRIKKHNISF